MKRTFSVVGSAKQLGARQSQYVELKNALNALGLEESKTLESDLVVFVNYNRKLLRKVKNHDSKLVLIRLEPRAVLPIQYKKRIENKYDLIITPGGQVDSESKFIGWPYKYDLNPSKPDARFTNLKSVIKEAVGEGYFEIEQWNAKKNAVVLVAANKVSPTSKSNYSTRRHLAKNLSPQFLYVYGPLWQASIINLIVHSFRVMVYSIRTGYLPNIKEIYGNLFAKYLNFVSEPDDKHEVIREFKYSLVIENSSDYCSEKIFDAMINGSIPIYVGPKIAEKYLPSSLYLWCGGSAQELTVLVETFTEKNSADMLKSMKDYLVSDEFRENWQSDKVYEKIAKEIRDLI
jgi:hypothetical protein